LWVDSRIFSDSSVPAVARASRIAPTRVATMERLSSASVNSHAANSWTPAAYVSRTSPAVGSRAMVLIPHHSDAADEGALPDDYRKILAIVREADGPVQVRSVGEWLGLDASVRGKLEPLRAKKTKLADRGRLHKRP
jgi:hypothetical protein